MIEILSFLAGVLVTLLVTTLRQRARTARQRRRLTAYLTPRLLAENARRDTAIKTSALPESFWYGRN